MMHDTLKRYFDEQGITQQQVADALGVSLQYVNQLLNGRKTLGKKNAERLANLYGLSKPFLLTGEGSITQTADGSAIPETEAVSTPTVVEQAANIIDLYAGLIKEIELLRADLSAELEAVRKERQEAQRLTTMLHNCLFYARDTTRQQQVSMPHAADEGDCNN